MKTFPVLCLVYVILLEASAIDLVNFPTNPSQDVVVPVTTNTVYLQKPFCEFPDYSACISSCNVWLVAAQDSAMNTFDTDKTIQNFVSLSSYPNTFNTDQKNYFVTKLGPQSNFCPSTTPSYFQVGAEGACNTANCNGVLPEGSAMRFKYLLVSPTNNLIAETNWSDNIILKTTKNATSLGSGYAGRSAAMVVITSILCVAAALLLLLLLIALILACCYRRGKSNSYQTSQRNQTRRQPSLIETLRIPSYDVHHLKSPSPYDNPAYEQELNKKRYTVNSTLPQKTTTVITTVHDNSADTITLQKM